MSQCVRVVVENCSTAKELVLEWSTLNEGSWTAPLPEVISGTGEFATQSDGYALGVAGSARYRIIGHEDQRLGTVGVTWHAPFVESGTFEAWVASSPTSGRDFVIGLSTDVDAGTELRIVLRDNQGDAAHGFTHRQCVAA